MDIPINENKDSTTNTTTNDVLEKKLKESESRGIKTLEFSNKGLNDILFFSAFNLQHVQVY